MRLVGEVEKASSQLSSWNQVSCLTMIDVDNLNRMLPSSVKMEWQRRYYQLSQPDRLHPFPVFMQFLIQERSVFTRLAEQQTTHTSYTKSHSHAQTTVTDRRRKEENSNSSYTHPRFYKCAVHKNEQGRHSTDQCKEFQQLSLERKMSVLREVGACFRC